MSDVMATPPIMVDLECVKARQLEPSRRPASAGIEPQTHIASDASLGMDIASDASLGMYIASDASLGMYIASDASLGMYIASCNCC